MGIYVYNIQKGGKTLINNKKGSTLLLATQIKQMKGKKKAFDVSPEACATDENPSLSLSHSL